MVVAWCFGCCQAHQSLPVGFLLLWYSVLCTVESLYLLYLLFISWFICSRRWCMDKLGIFHANQNLCVLIHIWSKGEVGAWNRFKPSSKIFLLTVPRQYFFCGSFVLFMSCDCQSFASVHCCLVVTCLEGLTSWLLFVMFVVVLLLSHVVSWVRCDTWLYPFLIFAISLTFTILTFSLKMSFMQ